MIAYNEYLIETVLEYSMDMKHKNILMVAYTNYLTDARPRREAEALAERGDYVTIISLAENQRPQKENLNGVNINRVDFERYRGDNKFKYIYYYFKYFIVVSLFAIRFVIQRKIDVIYIHTMPDFMVFVAIIPKLFGVKVVLNIHDMMPEIYLSKFNVTENHVLIRLLKYQEQLSIKFADQVICVHQKHFEKLLERGAKKEKMSILLNLPDPKIFHLHEEENNSSSTTPRIVFHGTIAKRSGLEHALDAFKIVANEVQNLRFDIFGDGDFVNEIEKK